jgi:hypothetical protein
LGLFFAAWTAGRRADAPRADLAERTGALAAGFLAAPATDFFAETDERV